MAQEHADIIYSGGTILPLTGCDATLEAVAVKDGVILAWRKPGGCREAGRAGHRASGFGGEHDASGLL